MSALYNLEPQPTAQVLLTTTSGDILLDLFAKQTPLTSRNFLQLCLDGYYNDTIFYRLVPSFIIQGGDPTGTGSGGEAIYRGGLFDDEFHSRLKYNRRGLLGMANGGTKNDNGSQFFITLGATPELQGRNTMFGRVVGDTMFNVMKMGEGELESEGSERPLYPTKVTGTQVLVNPFEDMVRTERKVKEVVKEAADRKEKKGKKRGGKALLSFGAEEAVEEEQGRSVMKKEKFNSKLVSASEQNGSSKTLNGDAGPTAKPADKSLRRKVPRSPTPPSPLAKPDRHTQLPLPKDEETEHLAPSSPEAEVVSKVSSLLDRTNAQIAAMKASMKRTVAAPVPEHRKKSALEAMIPETSVRGRKRRAGGGGGNTDSQTMDVLNAFRARLENAAATTSPSSASIDITASGSSPAPGNSKSTNHAEGKQKEEDEEAVCDLHFIVNCQSCKSWQAAEDADAGGSGADVDDKSWMSHALSFEKDRLGKDLTWKKKNEEELVVIDPREKARDIKEEERARKKARLTGNGGRAWDREKERGKG
ncbi:MAG: hypothetical protein Q9191_003206 [Dirinaria sp. TL-2023a]